MSTLFNYSEYSSLGLMHSNKIGEGNKGVQIGEEEIKAFSFQKV